MSDRKDGQEKLIAAARNWAENDVCDPNKQRLLDMYLALGGLDAELLLRMEMKRNP